MGILWCGNEDIDFPNGAICRTAAGGRSGYGRQWISQETAARGVVFAGGAITSAWLSFVCANQGNGVNLNLICGLGKSGIPLSGVCIGTSNAGTRAAIYKVDNGTYTKLADEKLNSLIATQKVDVYISNYNNASCNILVYVGGGLVIDYTGDPRATGITDLDQVLLGGRYFDWRLEMGVTEVIVADVDTRGMSVVTLYPNGAGNANEFSGGTYASVDEAAIDDTDYISDTVTAHEFDAACSNLPSGSFGVKAVKSILRASGVSTAMEVGLRSGSTTDLGVKANLNLYWFPIEKLCTVNPVGGATFTLAEVDALQFACKTAVP